LPGRGVRVINVYGPTEGCDVSSFYVVDRENLGAVGRIPVGRPLSNVQLYVLGAHGNLQPIGVSGELYISGRGLGRGYLNQPELTAEKFVNAAVSPSTSPQPLNPKSQLLYKTGDLCRFLPHGNVEFLGRVDHQVKIRGFRIELGEIENLLLKHSLIREAVVLAREDAGKEKYLAAYIVPSPNTTSKTSRTSRTNETNQTSPSILRQYLSRTLPDYMIPAHFVWLEKLPLTANGKIDRRALPEPTLDVTGQYVAPADDVEEKLAALWADILSAGKEKISTAANFFELGGHSLKAVTLISRIHKEFDVRVPLAELFKNPTIKGMAGYVRGGVQERFAFIEAVEKREYYALSSAQKRLYILHQMNPDGTSYNIPMSLILEGRLDRSQLQQSFTKLVDRHHSLRTSFEMIEGRPVQRIHEQVDLEIAVESLPPQADLSDRVSRFLRPFDLSRVPLLRVGLVILEDTRHLLMVDIHHIVTDGTSMAVLMSEFTSLYGGRQLPRLRLQYKDYARWQRSGSQAQAVKAQEDYWMSQFEGEIPVLALPTDRPRPPVQRFEGRCETFALSREESQSLKALLSERGVTLYMLLLAIYNILLSKLAGQEDIVVGTPVAGRRHVDVERIIGMFVNTLALRNYPVGEKPFAEFLHEVSGRTLRAFENQEYPFEELVERLSVSRDTGRNPLFDVMFSLGNIDGVEVEGVDSGLSDLQFKPFDNGSVTSKFDMSMAVGERGDEIELSVTYSSQLFRQETIERWLGYFRRVVGAVTADAGVVLGEIDILTESERAQILETFNAVEADYPEDKVIHQLFEAQAEATADRTALVYEASQLSYRELNRRAGRLSLLLRSKGVEPGTIVGLMKERSLDMLIGILGILKSGGAYLPIAPDYPPDRISYMLKDSGAELLLTGREIRSSDTLTSGLAGGSPSISATPVDPAYVIYTSGSTGKPKGVMIAQRSAVNILSALQRSYPLTAADVYLLKTSYVFDVSVTELFGWFFGEGRLAILAPGEEKDPQAILTAIERYGVTHINFVPSMFHVFVEGLAAENIGKLSCLRYIFLAGEALLGELVNRFRQLDERVILGNIYGPTEATIYASGYPLAQWDGVSSIPIGRPLSNMKLYVLNQNRYLQPVGVAGELCISGVGVGIGYLNRPELTAEKFVNLAASTTPSPQPLNPKSHILYRTGDLCRFLPDGNVEYLGRIDHQVKIRGFRIELGEIESRLLCHPGVREAAVVARSHGSGDTYLCAYIVPFSTDKIDWTSLRQYLAGTLPDYMIPGHFVQLERLPLTVSGKLDRRALPVPTFKDEESYAAPRDEIEKNLVKQWAEVLAIDEGMVGIDSNFFQLGGHSLKAAILISALNRVFAVKVPLLELFKAPTIRRLAKYIKVEGMANMEPADDNLVLLKKFGSERHLFFIHDGTGEVDGYVEFCRHINNRFNCWGIRADRLQDYTPQNITIESMARKYVEKMKCVQPTGPYRIVGWSLGGTIAFEMARQLEQENEEVGFLGLIDSPPPRQNGRYSRFSFKSELEFVQALLPGNGLPERLRAVTRMNQIWPLVVDYLEAGHVDVEVLKERIKEYGIQALPNDRQLDLRASIYYLNAARTLVNARTAFTNHKRIEAPIHYFAADRSVGIKKNNWRRNTRQRLFSYEIKGDHYSIFRQPQVDDFSRLFDQVIGQSEP
jgi:amino acid adenylation domain-containing protein